MKLQILACLWIAGVLTACSEGSSSSPMVNLPVPSASGPSSNMTSHSALASSSDTRSLESIAATKPAPRVYVVDHTGNAVRVYSVNPSGTSNEAPLATISGSDTGLNDPNGIALDAAGNIYVVQSNSVMVYAANPSGTLNETPLATISGSNTGLNDADAIALDAGGNIYVANYGGNSVTVYAANPRGTLFNDAPLATISGGNTGLSGPSAIALDSSGKLYVTNYGSAGNSVTVYAANPSGTLNEAPLATISGSSTGLSEPVGVALGANGKIYVTNYRYGSSVAGRVQVFAADPSGTLNEAALGTISGSHTELLSADGVAIH